MEIRECVRVFPLTVFSQIQSNSSTKLYICKPSNNWALPPFNGEMPMTGLKVVPVRAYLRTVDGKQQHVRNHVRSLPNR